MTHIRSIEIGGYRHNSKGFLQKFDTYQRSRSKGRTNTTQSAHTNFVQTFSFLLSLFVKSVEDKIQFFGDFVDTTRGWTLEKLITYH